MAKKELIAQRNICKSVKTDGGYARKLSHSFLIGWPDLIIMLFPFVPCLAEVKDMGECVGDFDRAIGITDKQQLELKRISEQYELEQTVYTPRKRTAFILVALVHRGEHRLVALPRDAERLSAGYEAEPQRWVKRQQGGYYDLKPLLEWAGIAVLRLM